MQQIFKWNDAPYLQSARLFNCAETFLPGQFMAWITQRAIEGELQLSEQVPDQMILELVLAELTWRWPGFARVRDRSLQTTQRL